MELLDIITDLSRVPGPAGFEGAATKAAEEFITPFVDEVRTDALGSVIALKRCGKEGAKKLMLCAHIDEIGLIVTGYEKGFLRLSAIGGMDSRCLPASRVKVLTRQTREDNARFFGGDVSAVPTLCLTQGLATIMSARHLLLLATGAGKAEAVAQLVEGAVSAKWPGTVMQLHPHATVLVDDDAASRLELADYYREAYALKPRWQVL